jgi:hypothetical protein
MIIKIKQQKRTQPITTPVMREPLSFESKFSVKKKKKEKKSNFETKKIKL